jgi:hypothetical protein
MWNTRSSFQPEPSSRRAKSSSVRSCPLNMFIIWERRQHRFSSRRPKRDVAHQNIHQDPPLVPGRLEQRLGRRRAVRTGHDLGSAALLTARVLHDVVDEQDFASRRRRACERLQDPPRVSRRPVVRNVAHDVHRRAAHGLGCEHVVIYGAESERGQTGGRETNGEP